jgi:predicted acylesterase/phospholipase RssA
VDGYVSGVFEGGGAKGILYAGALEGLLRRKLWFSAVAGSSAGAITAAMIAAGMKPSEIGAQREAGLTAMATPTRWNGFRRVRWGTGFLDHDRILAWLSELLSKRCGILGLDVNKKDGPTFEQLSELTGIDLFVAAVDLRARHLAVFNAALTPRAAVAEAVIASATIPFAFEPRLFQWRPSADAKPRWRLFVDGGVASNFPSFVFQDEAFRKYSRLEPIPVRTPVVGFLLDETHFTEQREEAREETRDVYRRGTFIGAYYEGASIVRSEAGSRGESFKRPQFRTDPRVHWPAPLRKLVRRGLSVVELAVLEFVWFLGFANGRSGPRDAFTWNWGEPKRGRARLRVAALRPWLAPPPLQLIIGIGAYTAVFLIGFVVSVRHVAPWIGGFEVVGLILGVVVGLAACVLAVSIFLLGLLMFLAAVTTRRAVGVLGSGVLQTYLNTSAPPWAGSASNECLVRLEIPPGIRTLRIDRKVDVEAELARAEEATFSALEGIRGAPFPGLS